MPRERVWTKNWRRMKDEHGFSREQAKVVFRLLDDHRAFGSLKNANSAMEQLEEVYRYGK